MDGGGAADEDSGVEDGQGAAAEASNLGAAADLELVRDGDGGAVEESRLRVRKGRTGRRWHNGHRQGAWAARASSCQQRAIQSAVAQASSGDVDARRTNDNR